MTDPSEPSPIEHLVRRASGRVLATLIRQLGDIDLAEDALGDALLIAAERWPVDGAPDSPEAWLLTVARRRAIDRIRRERERESRQRAAHLLTDPTGGTDEELAEERWRSGVQDDRLRLIFTCCHPALGTDAQIALTLRTVAGLSTSEIARGFLVPEATMAQRLVRAKRKIRVAGIPYRVPAGHDLPDRLSSALRVIYLVFNEGYLSSGQGAPVRVELTERAIELGRLLCELMPDEPEVQGLLSLMLVQHARRDARVDADGTLVTSEFQDRSRWRHDEIAEGEQLVEAALSRRSPGRYQLQAAIAVLGATAPTFADTDWRQIAALYEELYRFEPTVVVELNRAVAVSFGWGPGEGLSAVDAIARRGVLDDYHLLHATRGDLLRRLDRTDEALVAFTRARSLTSNPSEQAFLQQRIDELAPHEAVTHEVASDL